MARDDDAMLVEACLHGDRHAFDKLVDRYEGPLFSAAYRITGSVEDAMDATQNAFVNAYEKLHTFDPTYRFFSWIYRIAVNEAIYRTEFPISQRSLYYIRASRGT